MRILLALLAALGVAQAQPYDLLITHGRIVDGAGGPWYYADLAIRGDTIAAIGNLTGASARSTIDANGMVVAPGFLDIHTHARRGIFAVPPSGRQRLVQSEAANPSQTCVKPYYFIDDIPQPPTSAQEAHSRLRRRS